jgi:hypothetical protein
MSEVVLRRSWWLAFLDVLRGWFGGEPLPEIAAAPRLTRALPDLEPLPPEEGISRPTEHVRIGIDFGTSTSTVARAVAGGEPEVAVLQADPRTGRKVSTIDSDVLWEVGQPAVLGGVARLLQERGEAGKAEVHRSLKRMLSDLRRLPDSHVLLRLRVSALVEELLRLALDPEASGTVRAQSELAAVPSFEIARHLGLPGRGSLAEAVARGTLDLYLCVPNAFGNFEEEVLRSAAARAGEALQREIAERRGIELDEPAVVVHLIREAEAVAWWVLHARHLRSRAPAQHAGTWLVFDLGAGSTDAAVVIARTGAAPAEVAEVRSLFHSGVAFGGHDVDELLLRLVAERSGDEVPAGIERRVAGAATTRALQLRQFSDAKEAWSRSMSDAFARSAPDATTRWLTWVLQPQGAMPGGDALPPFRPTTALWPEVKELAGPAWGEDYARWLRGTAAGVLDALVAAHPGTKVDRVILSGRGTLLPGVRAMVTKKLLDAGWIGSPEAVEMVDAQSPEKLKLACVQGIAVAAAHAAIPPELPQVLAEEVSLGRHAPLWRRGQLLHETTARAAFALEAHDGPRRLVFHQDRCPREVADAIGVPSLWEHRHLGSAELHLFDPVELHATFDARTGQLRIWRLAESGPVPVPLETDPLTATGTNPVSRLPFGWVDA